jgi:hypothetical protein
MTKTDNGNNPKNEIRPDIEKVDSTIGLNNKPDSGLDEQPKIDSLTAVIRDETHQDLTTVDKFDSTKCDLNIVLEVSENQDNLDLKLVSRFLRTLNGECTNNVEFSEFSNEMLFVVLVKRPDLFLKSYKSQIHVIDTGYINSELQSPLHDLIPLKEIIAKIDSIDFDPEIKKMIFNNLEKGKWW